jgi:hypothetical protein
MANIQHLLSCSSKELYEMTWHRGGRFLKNHLNGKVGLSYSAYLIITTDISQWIIMGRENVFHWQRSKGFGHGLIHRHFNSSDFHYQKQIAGKDGCEYVEGLLTYIIEHDYVPARWRGMYTSSSKLDNSQQVHIHYAYGELRDVKEAAKKIDILKK